MNTRSPLALNHQITVIAGLAVAPDEHELDRMLDVALMSADHQLGTNAKNAYGDTPLITAVKSIQPRIVSWLFKQKNNDPEINAINYASLTALDCAVQDRDDAADVVIAEEKTEKVTQSKKQPRQNVDDLLFQEDDFFSDVAFHHEPTAKLPDNPRREIIQCLLLHKPKLKEREYQVIKLACQYGNVYFLKSIDKFLLDEKLALKKQYFYEWLKVAIQNIKENALIYLFDLHKRTNKPSTLFRSNMLKFEEYDQNTKQEILQWTIQRRSPTMLACVLENLTISIVEPGFFVKQFDNLLDDLNVRHDQDFMSKTINILEILLRVLVYLYINNKITLDVIYGRFENAKHVNDDAAPDLLEKIKEMVKRITADRSLDQLSTFGLGRDLITNIEEIIAKKSKKLRYG